MKITKVFIVAPWAGPETTLADLWGVFSPRELVNYCVGRGLIVAAYTTQKEAVDHAKVIFAKESA